MCAVTYLFIYVMIEKMIEKKVLLDKEK